ncbi:hypothetical protein HDV05_006480 [Chytridiales sp. JEL 0842]|nr:hypothetical protein HDV05_006480 [Chytridiales sp. JEL 0842]
MKLTISVAAALAALAITSFTRATAAQAVDVPQLTVNGSLWLSGFLPAEDPRNPAANGTDGYAILRTVDFNLNIKENELRLPTAITIQLLCNVPGQLLRLVAPKSYRLSSDNRNYVIPSNETQVFYITTDSYQMSASTNTGLTRLQIQRANGYRNNATCDLFVQLNQPTLENQTRPVMLGRDIPASSFGGKLIAFNESTTPDGFVATPQISTPVFKSLNSAYAYDPNCYRPQLIAPLMDEGYVRSMPLGSAVKITLEYDAPGNVTDGPFTVFYKYKYDAYEHHYLETDVQTSQDILSFSPVRTITTADGRQRSTYDMYLGIQFYTWNSGAICIRPNQIKGDEYKVSFTGVEGKDAFLAGTRVTRTPGAVTTFSTGDISAATGPRTFTIHTVNGNGMKLFSYAQCSCASSGEKAPQALPSLAWPKASQKRKDLMHLDVDGSPLILANGSAVFLPSYSDLIPKVLDFTGITKLTVSPGADNCNCQVTIEDDFDTTKDFLYPTKENPTTCAFDLAPSKLTPGQTVSQQGQFWASSREAFRFVYPQTTAVEQISVKVYITIYPKDVLDNPYNTILFNDQIIGYRECKKNYEISGYPMVCEKVFTFKTSTTGKTSNCVNLYTSEVNFESPNTYNITVTDVTVR